MKNLLQIYVKNLDCAIKSVFLHSKYTELKPNVLFILIFVLFLSVACRHKQERMMTPWGEEMVVDADGQRQPLRTDGEAFDLSDIQNSGELIALTLSGPQTCYDYRGSRLGLHVMLCQQLADSLGVRLRVELCRDTADLFQRYRECEADLVAYPVTPLDSLSPGWLVPHDKPQLQAALAQWYSLRRVAIAQHEEQQLVSTGGVKRKVFAPMLDRKGGIISRYDALFQRYAQPIRWDWRLMAAQCYQESTFDPHALSWAGAHGLMQIMPQTADHLGLPRAQLNDPEQNIAAAARYLEELERDFSDIPSRRERQDFVLAAYNGGRHHIRDAMELTRLNGGNVHRWADVAVYVLKLSEPAYYQHPSVRYGYMRGSETVGYVRSIRQRYQQYQGVKAKVLLNSSPQKSRNKKHRSKFHP